MTNKRYWRWLCLAMVMISLSAASVAQAASLFMGIDEVRPGMKGIGKTVVAGTTIEPFDVEIIDVMRQPGGNDLILVRTSGAAIERSGGIAQGMSGSPVFVDGRLVGAIAYGWKLSDSRVGMLTPIESMLKLGAAPASDATAAPAAETPALLPKGTPLMASGFTERGLEKLRGALSTYGLEPMAVGAAPGALAGTELEPGSALSAELIRGDVSLGALGTVTWVDGNRIWAFGHPFLRRGASDYFLSNAWVYATIPSISSPFKVGAPGELLGRITDDRQAGLAGETKHYPKIIPMLVKVKDLDRGVAQEAAIQVVQDQQLGAMLTETAVFNVIDRVVDRVGPGTANIKFHVSAVGTPDDKQIERSNMYYNEANIASAITEELNEAVNLLLTNRFQPVTIMDVGVEIEVGGARKTGTIVSARALEKQARPGETVTLEVAFDTWRGGKETRQAVFTIPKEREPGELRLVVRGGAGTSWLQQLMKQQEQNVLRKAKKKEKSFAEIMNDFLKRDRNNDLLVDVADKQPAAATAAQSAASAAPAGEEEVAEGAALGAIKGSKYKQATTIDYVIDGEAYANITVVK